MKAFLIVLLKIKNKRKKQAKRTKASDDVPKGDDDNKKVKGNSRDIKK